MLDADLANGDKDGYTIRYTITPAPGGLAEDEANKAETFSLGFLSERLRQDGTQVVLSGLGRDLRGADKHGGVATPTDPRIGPS